MSLLGVRIGSHIIKNLTEFPKFLRKVEQCGIFVEKRKKIDLELQKKNYATWLLFLIYEQLRYPPKNIKNKILIFLLH
jgi:hypothetical protein